MFRLRFFKTIFILLIAIAIIHIVSLSNSLYILIPHLDTILHTVAGFVIALSTISLIEKFYPHVALSNESNRLLILVLVAVVVIGVGWEVFQYFIRFSLYFDIEDTITDVVADVIGAMLGYGMYRFIKW